MSQCFIADIKVTRFRCLSTNTGGQIEILMQGYTTGKNPLFTNIKVIGSDAYRCSKLLKNGCRVGVHGYLFRDKNATNLYQQLIVVADEVIEFKTGFCRVDEVINLKPATAFADSKNAKDYLATVLQPFGFRFLPIHTISQIKRLVNSQEDLAFYPVVKWLNALEEYFKEDTV